MAQLFDAFGAIDAVRFGNGHVVEVADAEIYAAQEILARESGLLVEPAGATAYAGVLADACRGVLDRADRVIVIGTGAGYKDAAALNASPALAACRESVRPRFERYSMTDPDVVPELFSLRDRWRSCPGEPDCTVGTLPTRWPEPVRMSCSRPEASARASVRRRSYVIWACWLTHIELDLTSEESIVRLRDEVVSRHGRIDVLVNNAVARAGSTVRDTSAAEWAATSTVNSLGTFLITRECGEQMIAQGSGVFINIASIYGMVGPDFSIYGETGMTNPAFYAYDKGGMINFTRYLATAYAPYGIRANCISPGGLGTPDQPARVRRELHGQRATGTPRGCRRHQGPDRVPGLCGVGLRHGRQSRRGRRLDGQIVSLDRHRSSSSGVADLRIASETCRAASPSYTSTRGGTARPATAMKCVACARKASSRACA